MSRSVGCLGRKLSRDFGREAPLREAVLAETGCHGSRLAKKGSTVLDHLKGIRLSHVISCLETAEIFQELVEWQHFAEEVCRGITFLFGSNNVNNSDDSRQVFLRGIAISTPTHNSPGSSRFAWVAGAAQSCRGTEHWLWQWFTTALLQTRQEWAAEQLANMFDRSHNFGLRVHW